MSILSDFEDRIGRAVEGGFARVFRSPVQPAELAHRLGREADRRRVVGVGKVYAPTLYSVLLSAEDDERLGGFADTLAGELETYLVGYAREHNYALATRPIVRFLVDEELRLGRFDVIGELLSPDEMAAELGEDVVDARLSSSAAGGVVAAPAPAAAAPLSEADVPPVVREPHVFDADAPREAGSGALDPGAAAVDLGLDEFAHHESGPATVTVRGVDHDVVLRGDRMVIGRLSACDICLADSNTSRQHAAFVREGDDWAIEDLGSTNGTFVNGSQIDFRPLREGDVIVVGVTELVYHEPRG